jgi:hypothetical protein
LLQARKSSKVGSIVSSNIAGCLFFGLGSSPDKLLNK